MPVEFPCAALRAGSTAEPDLPDDLSETFYRIFKETVAFVGKGSDA
jgi:hypothetical protein